MSSDAAGDWNWQDELRLDLESPLDITSSLWDELTKSEDDSKNLLQATPIDNAYDRVPHCQASPPASGNTASQQTLKNESPMYKRRRMLQFPASDSDSKSNVTPVFATLEECREMLMEENMDGPLSEPVSSPSLWLSRNEEGNSSASDSLDQSCDWMTRCLSDDMAMVSNSDDYRHVHDGFDDRIDVSELCAALQTTEMDAEAPSLQPTHCLPSSGRNSSSSGSANSNNSSSTSLGRPVAYPFALIKPCSVQGDVTLKDINHRISSSTKSGQAQDVISSGALRGRSKHDVPTSALSGKAIVHLTKIHTGGGKGSITIMRTRG